MVLGTGGKRFAVGGQVAFEGGVAEHEPLHWTVPVFVWPQAFAAEVQAVPSPTGLAGVVALQVPLHWMVPVFVCPHEFAAEVHAEPKFAGFAGAAALHEPLHWTVPVFVWPHAFAAEVQAAFWFATQEFTVNGIESTHPHQVSEKATLYVPGEEGATRVPYPYEAEPIGGT